MTDFPWPGTGQIDAAVEAIERGREAKRQQRREASQELFGHPGASIPSVKMPTLHDEVRLALRTIRDSNGDRA